MSTGRWSQTLEFLQEATFKDVLLPGHVDSGQPGDRRQRQDSGFGRVIRKNAKAFSGHPDGHAPFSRVAGQAGVPPFQEFDQGPFGVREPVGRPCETAGVGGDLFG
ncbi:hypothetical protein [Actinomadura sp. 3N407]|uniref:hypothetical protein n=1 Tax=Actinomadura sp. 3N407 TaxID=3457423 RepID=UPI003FCEE30F